MLEWMIENAATLGVGLALAVLLALAVRRLARSRRRGECVGCPAGGCGHSCGGSHGACACGKKPVPGAAKRGAPSGEN